jgi:hypothetical protein
MTLKQFKAQVQDNVFNADHRNAMIEKYGYTEAMRLKIEDLVPEEEFNMNNYTVC